MGIFASLFLDFYLFSLVFASVVESCPFPHAVNGEMRRRWQSWEDKLTAGARTPYSTPGTSGLEEKFFRYGTLLPCLALCQLAEKGKS